MISLEEARHIIAQHTQSIPSTAVALRAVLGGVLRETATASEFFPEVDRAMMDGYAVGAEDAAERFRVIGEIAPGGESSLAVQAGECVRIFTGGAVPPGASQVLKQEDVSRDGEWMTPARRDAVRFIRPRGAEARPGDVVLAAGTVLGPAELAILAQIGHVRPSISRSPRVAHLATGGELADPAAPLAPGQIRDTNSSLIAALVAESGAELVAHARWGDDLARIVSFIRENPADLLLISGGASVGEHDFGARALRESGYTIHFDKINLRPGKPLTFATRGAEVAVVIPGNPVSHFVCFHVGIRLVIECLLGRAPRWEFLDLPLGGDTALRRDARETFWPARVVAREGRLIAEPLRWSSSGDTFALAGTNALIRLAADREPGAAMPVLLLNR